MGTSWELLLGSQGALVLAIALLGWLLRRAQEAHRELLRDLHTTRAQLEAEHAGRLADAKATTTTLLEVTERIHRTLDNLERLQTRRT